MADEPRVGVYMLDVGQGDCTFIVGPEADASPVLFDCRDEYVAERFVKDHGIRALSAAVASHLDLDHIRGMLPFLRAFLRDGGKVGALYANVDQKPDPTLRHAAYLFLQQATRWDEAGTIPLAGAFREGSTRQLCGGPSWSVDLVLPRYGALVGMRLADGEAPNRTSAVLRVSVGSRAILIGGDATLGSWERLEDRLLAAEVFRIPHHGGNIDEGEGTWSIADVYRRVAPRIAVISVGTNNSHEHPRLDMLPIAPRAGGSCRLLCTQLTQRCHEDPWIHRDRAIENSSAVAYPYRHRVRKGDQRKQRPREEVPCAGSMVAWLTPSGVQVEPVEGDWHDDFVELLDHPLCRPAPLGS